MSPVVAATAVGPEAEEEHDEYERELDDGNDEVKVGDGVGVGGGSGRGEGGADGRERPVDEEGGRAGDMVDDGSVSNFQWIFDCSIIDSSAATAAPHLRIYLQYGNTLKFKFRGRLSKRRVTRLLLSLAVVGKLNRILHIV